MYLCIEAREGKELVLVWCSLFGTLVGEVHLKQVFTLSCENKKNIEAEIKDWNFSAMEQQK